MMACFLFSIMAFILARMSACVKLGFIGMVISSRR